MNKQQNSTAQLCIVFFLPIVIASLIRFWCLDIRPFHSDEGVNSFFLLNLFNRNYYHYDPANYHGPFLYYIGLIPFYVLGISDFSFRLMPVLFGIMIVALLYPLRRRLGKMGLLTTGLLIALSPANSFFSKDTIHETYLVFFSLAVVVSFFLYAETRKSRYIYFASASLACIITIKETYILTFAVFVASLTIAYLYEWIANLRLNALGHGLKSSRLKAQSSTFKAQSSKPATCNSQSARRIFAAFTNDCIKHKYAIGISIGLFLFINILFYSSFFTYAGGIHGILTTLKIWSKTGTHSGGHAKPFLYYFKVLYKYELSMTVLGIAGFYYAFRQRNKFTVFVASWTIIIYLVYSFIPYKTPWLILNILLPLSLMGGIFIHGIFALVTKKWHAAVFYPVYVGIFGFICYQSILLNFVNYDDERSELVYVQTKRDVYNLLDRLKVLSNISGKNLTINIVSKEYWPLPWYLRDYKNARFWGNVIDNPNAPVILVDNKGEAELKKKLRGDYKKERFVLRPGVWITAYVQKGLYETVFGTETTSGKITLPPVAKVSEEELEQGLTAKYFYNIECIGTPFLSKVENTPISFTYNDETKKPYRSPFGIEWEGYLHIERKGVYQFATKSDDGSVVYVDGQMVVDNDDLHAVRYISSVAALDEGFHHIRVKYFDGGGGAVMEFLWTPPEGQESLVPARALFHK